MIKIKKKVIIITGCSKTKLDHPAAAENLNQGQLFKKSKKLANQHHFDLKILSGKYGLLDRNQIIEPYDQKIKTKADIERIRTTISPKINQIKRDYDLIIIIMGKTYQKTIKFFIDHKFRILYHPKGYFGYLKLLNKYLKLPRKELLSELEQFNPFPQESIFSRNKTTIGEWL